MADFDKYAEHLRQNATLADSWSDDDKLQVYALFKQGSVGDCNTSRPGMLDFKGKAKWEAWNGQKGKSKDAAQTEYIALAKTLLNKYGLADLANSF